MSLLSLLGSELCLGDKADYFNMAKFASRMIFLLGENQIGKKERLRLEEHSHPHQVGGSGIRKKGQDVMTWGGGWEFVDDSQTEKQVEKQAEESTMDTGAGQGGLPVGTYMQG